MRRHGILRRTLRPAACSFHFCRSRLTEAVGDHHRPRGGAVNPRLSRGGKRIALLPSRCDRAWINTWAGARESTDRISPVRSKCEVSSRDRGGSWPREACVPLATSLPGCAHLASDLSAEFTAKFGLS